MKNRYKMFVMFLLLMLAVPTNVFAAEQVVSKIDSLNQLVLGIVSSAGVIVLAWGVFEFASSYQSRDTSQQTDALKKVVSGIIMVAAPAIIELLK